MDWLKELLKKAGIEEGKLDGVIADINKELPKYMIPKDKYNEVAEAKKKLEADLQARDTQLEELKKAAGTSEELKKQIEQLQADNKKAAEEWQTKFAQMQLDFAVERALTTAKAKNVKAVKALLDMEKVKLDGEQLLGLDDQLKAIKESDPYLFGDPGKVGSGTNPPGANNTEVNPWKKETFNLTLQGKILREDPAKAARMKAEAGGK
ncbi:MAG: phage minor structural GP20 [Firmicutes bacterium]|nr:phage minor structural GP20 [Bacillota bacterium]